MKIVVIGGTGLIGAKLVAKLEAAGHEALPASPRSGVNALTGEGLSEALRGAAVVVDVSNSPSFEDAAAMNFFTTSTQNVLAAEAAGGIGHHVALSVVGSERLPNNGYFRAKLAQEALIKASGTPHSIVRATQFFEFSAAIAEAAAQSGSIRIPPVSFQPIAAEDVAAVLASVALGAPLNGTVEIGGPERFRFDAFIRRALSSQGDTREVIADPRAQYFGAELDDRTLVPGDHARLGEIRFEEWLRRFTPPLLGAHAKGATAVEPGERHGAC